MTTSLLRHARALSPTTLRTAFGAALITALVAAAGAELGLAATALAVPAGVLLAMARRRFDARSAGLMHLAHLDPLTGLPNAKELRQRLRYEILRHHRHQRRLAVFSLDVSGLKQINDRFGSVAGDEVLRELARQLKRALREQDTVVRLGGSEFAVLSPETGWREAQLLVERLGAAVSNAVGGAHDFGASIGFAVFPEGGATPEILLARAEAARNGQGARPSRPALRRAA